MSSGNCSCGATRSPCAWESRGLQLLFRQLSIPHSTAGLALVDAIAAHGELAGSRLLPSVRAEMLVRLGRMDDARTEYAHALTLSASFPHGEFRGLLPRHSLTHTLGLMVIPEALRVAIAGRTADGTGYPDGDDWLAQVLSLVEEHQQRWELTLHGRPWHGENALVLPVLRKEQQAVLKVTWPHREARHEHLALRVWDGRGAVRLLAANPSSSALLLERLDGNRQLTELPILQACEVVGELFQRLDRPPVPQLDTVADKAIRWQEQLSATSELVPRRLTHQARDELKALVASAPPARLVHEDLHDMNVLAPLEHHRGDWLAIDPKPVAGEWAYAVAPMVWNRADVTATAFSVRNHVRIRAEVIADVAELDKERVRRWTFVRLVLNAVWAATYSPGSNDFRTRMILLAKAFSD